MKTIRRQIVARIRDRLRVDDRIYFAESFSDICSPEIALYELHALAEKGELQVRAQFYSPSGHICFDDDAETMLECWPPVPCRACGLKLNLEDAVLYFALLRDPAYPEQYARPREALERILALADRKELREIYAIASEALAEGTAANPVPGTCKRPSDGWYCTRDAGHEGPCPCWRAP
jgi:hypothetical protein